MCKINLNYDWKFCEEFRDEYLAPDFDDSMFASVNIPHTVKEVPYNNFNEKLYQFVSCYRKAINIPESYQGKALVLEFEAVGHYAEVYVNGKFAFSHKGGYTAFNGDIANLVKYGESNVLVVKVDSTEREDIPPFGKVIDYLCYGGIYREAYLYVHNDIYIRNIKISPIDSLSAPKVEIEIFCNKLASGNMDCKIKDKNGIVVSKFNFAIKDSLNTKHLQTVNKIQLWDIENPELYTLEVEFNGETYVERFGFREAKFTKKGFFLNGKPLKIVGLNRHQSYPYVGYAMPASAQIADAEYLKMELGLNLVRTSHYPNDKHFLNRCDEIGLLVFTEIPGWQFVSEREDWRSKCVEFVGEMIDQQFNHPSIILWGVRINESKDDDALYSATNKLAHQLDKTRQTSGVRCFPQSKLLEDVYAFNDFSHSGKNGGLMPKFIVCGNVPLLISEHNGHMFPTKTFDYEKKRQEHLLMHARVLDEAFRRKNTCGAIGWVMSDYNTHKDFGSGDKICYHGVSDMFRINKLAAYLYKAQQDKYPVMEVTSNMEIGDNNGGQVGKVFMITNCDTVNLYKNNVLVNTFDINALKVKAQYKHLPHPPIELFDIIGDQLEKNNKFGFTKHAAERCKKFLLNIKEFGTLPAIFKMPHTLIGLMLKYKLNIDTITYLFGEYVTAWGDESVAFKVEGIKNGEKVCVEKAAVNSVELEVKADSLTLNEADTYDVTRITVRAVSQAGNVLPYANDVLTIRTEGAIEVIGDPCVALIGGQRGFWVKTLGKSGKAKVIVKSAIGIKEIEITVHKTL